MVYQALYGDFKTFIRPYEMFISEVDHEKYPDVTQKYRFQYVEDLTQLGKKESVQTDFVENKIKNGEENKENTSQIKMQQSLFQVSQN